MGKIEQLVYTWSDIGLSGQTAGFRIRAASQRLSDTRGPLYRKLAGYLPYKLPPGIHANAITEEEAPLCLALINTGTESILVRREFLATDGVGRPGAYLTHLLADLPANFSAREAILLWHNHLWVTSKNQLDRQTLLLEPLSEEQLSSPQSVGWQISDLDNFRIALRHALTYFLSSRPPYKLYPSGSSESIAALIWGITQSLPPELLPGMTFSTYEPTRTTAKETIVGLFSQQSLRSGEIIFYDNPTPLLSKEQKTRIEPYIDFAIDCLIQRIKFQKQEKDQLALFIDKIENNITDVNDLLNKYQEYDKQEQARQKAQRQEQEEKRQRELLYQAQLYKPEEKQPDESHDPVLASPLSTERSGPAKHQSNIQNSTAQNTLLQPVEYHRTSLEETTVRPWEKLGQFRLKPILYGLLLFSLLSLLLNVVLITHISNTASTTNNTPTRSTNIPSRTATATPTQPIQATPTPEPPLINGATFIEKNTPQSKANTALTFTIQVKNSGSSTWNAQQYQLKCIPDTSQGPDNDCPKQKTLASVNTSKAPGQIYTFTFTFRSPDPPNSNKYWIKVQMFQNQTPFGGTTLLYFTIT